MHWKPEPRAVGRCIHRLAICAVLLCAGAATAAGDEAAAVRQWAEDYFRRYAAREDWEGFLGLYAEELEFEDPMARIELDSKALFREFYFWPDPAFSKHPDHPQTLVVEDLIVHGRRSIASGYFTPFQYLGITFAEDRPMRFTIWLDWNSDGRITRQVDWIAYPPELVRSMYCREGQPDS